MVMSPFLAFLPLITASPQESLQLRINPPLGKVIEYATRFEAASADGTRTARGQFLIAERAIAQGANFRFNRYVSAVTIDGVLVPIKEGEEMKSLAGKTFPLLVTSTGNVIKGKRGKYENDSSKIPNFIPRYPRIIVPGQKVENGLDDMGGVAMTLREVRSYASGRAAIFSLENNLGREGSLSGTLLVSVEDGLPLALELSVNPSASSRDQVQDIRIIHRRLNVPGLDRLTADLKLTD